MPDRKGTITRAVAEVAVWVDNEILLLTTTGVIGYLTESWGTSHGHWTYAHLPPGSTVPN